MNYMYGKGVADELEAETVVRRIGNIIGDCEPDVHLLVSRKLRSQYDDGRATELFRNRLQSLANFPPLQAQNQQGSTLSALIGQSPFGRIW